MNPWEIVSWVAATCVALVAVALTFNLVRALVRKH
jgi:hypothetical protein